MVVEGSRGIANPLSWVRLPPAPLWQRIAGPLPTHYNLGWGSRVGNDAAVSPRHLTLVSWPDRRPDLFALPRPPALPP